MSALRFLNLIDADSRATARLKVLVPATGAHRAALLRQVAEEAYPFIFKGTIDTQILLAPNWKPFSRTLIIWKLTSAINASVFLLRFVKMLTYPCHLKLQKSENTESNQGINNTTKKVDTSNDEYHGMAILPVSIWCMN